MFIYNYFYYLWGGGYFAQENVIPDSGNVGIGTLNPTTKLDVHGRVNIDSFLVVKDSVTIQKNLRVLNGVDAYGLTNLNGQLKLGGLSNLNNLTNSYFLLSNNGGIVKKYSSEDLVEELRSSIYKDPIINQPNFCDLPQGNLNPTWSNGLNKIYSRCPEVFVGIGTESPKSALDVRGTTFTAKIAVNIDPAILGSELFHLKSNYSTNSPQFGNSPIFIIENTQRKIFQINNNGIVRAREVVLDLNTAWPDYVFKSDYSLIDYEDLRTYIASQGHLPNVPSAAEIKENGIEVGEMNVVMMEKIEELTLYILELESRIKRLETDKSTLNSTTNDN